MGSDSLPCIGNKVVMGIAPVEFACAMMLLGSSLFLQGCFGSGRSAPVYAPLPPREPDYAFQNETGCWFSGFFLLLCSLAEKKPIMVLKKSEN